MALKDLDVRSHPDRVIALPKRCSLPRVFLQSSTSHVNHSSPCRPATPFLLAPRGRPPTRRACASSLGPPPPRPLVPCCKPRLHSQSHPRSCIPFSLSFRRQRHSCKAGAYTEAGCQNRSSPPPPAPAGGRLLESRWTIIGRARSAVTAQGLAELLAKGSFEIDGLSEGEIGRARRFRLDCECGICDGSELDPRPQQLRPHPVSAPHHPSSHQLFDRPPNQSTMSAPVPPELKPISPYLARATELAKAEPVISYWCEHSLAPVGALWPSSTARLSPSCPPPLAGTYYAVQHAMTLGASEPESNEFLFGLMDKLEGVSGPRPRVGHDSLPELTRSLLTRGCS